MRRLGLPAIALGALLAAAACSAGGSVRDGRTIEEVAASRSVAECGRMETLGGDRIRLAPALDSARLRVRPALLAGDQMKFLLDEGWDLEAAAGAGDAGIRVKEDEARISWPASPCGDGVNAQWPMTIDVALSGDGPEGRIDRATASLSAPAGGVDVRTLAAPAPIGLLESRREDPARPSSVVVRSDPMGAVSAAGILLPLGHARIEAGSEYRDAIVASSIRKAEYRIVPPPRAVLKLALALVPGGRRGGGWEFRVTATGEEGAREIFREAVASADPEATDRWLSRGIPLPASAGREILLAFEAEPIDGDGALALWGSPIVEGDAQPARAGRPNILLVSVDTLRADRVGRVNQGHLLTPALERLASEGVRFTRCRAQAASTLYSHASMLTGLLVSAHGATPDAALSEAIPYAPDLLARSGYATAALTDDGLVDGRFGFPRGFDAYVNRAEPIETRVEEAISALEAIGSPWLLFVHTYQVHAPYADSPRFAEPLTRGYDGPFGSTYDQAVFSRALSRMNNGRIEASAEDIGHLENLYDAQVMRTDAALDGIFDALRAKGLWDATAVIVTGDHGDELDEHGLLARHSQTCYEELMRVPLIVKPPSGSASVPAVIDADVSLVDVAPTLLDLAGLPAPEPEEGFSLLPLVRGEKTIERESVCEMDDARGAAIVKDGWKYVKRERWSVEDPRTLKRRLDTWGPYPEEELYDLAADPGERHNLVGAQPQRASELRALLDAKLAAARAYFAEKMAGADAPRRPQEDAEHLEQLRALGYVE